MIDRESRGPVEGLRLERGPVNVLDLELLAALEQDLADIERSPAPAVVSTGGGRCFSAGVDLRRVLEGGADYVAAFVPRIATCFRRLFAFPKPVVGIVDEVVESEGLLDAALESAQRLGSLTPEGFRLAKLQLRGPALDLADRLSRDREADVVRAWSSAETAEAIRGYLERTLGRRS